MFHRKAKLGLTHKQLLHVDRGRTCPKRKDHSCSIGRRNSSEHHYDKRGGECDFGDRIHTLEDSDYDPERVYVDEKQVLRTMQEYHLPQELTLVRRYHGDVDQILEHFSRH